MRAAIVGIAGTELSAGERALFAALPPAGVILFRRNIRDPGQVSALVAELREVLPEDAPLLVDQEGGRVARFRPPHWRAHPAAAAHGSAREAWLTGALIGLDCAGAGVRAVCAPVMDLSVPGASGVVGDRAWGERPEVVAERAGAMAAGLAAAGCIAIGKHAPGHGRARVDSHLALPRIGREVDLRDDLAVFRCCAGQVPWLMTAHIVYDRWDDMQPATWSAAVVRDVIRGEIGFGGVLVSDDLAMGALHGPAGARAERCWLAGVDLALHCSGELVESREVLEAAPVVAARVRAGLQPPVPAVSEPGPLAAERDAAMATAGVPA